MNVLNIKGTMNTDSLKFISNYISIKMHISIDKHNFHIIQYGQVEGLLRAALPQTALPWETEDHPSMHG